MFSLQHLLCQITKETDHKSHVAGCLVEEESLYRKDDPSKEVRKHALIADKVKE